MKFMRNLVSAILGGISIGLGSAAYLAVKDESILAAALLFSVGFLAAVIFELGLFTDKSGYLFERGHVENNIKRLFTTLFGNIIGSLVTGIALISKVGVPATAVFSENYYGLDFGFFFSSIIAGALIYIAVHGYRKAGGGFASCAILIFASAIIPVCGLEYALCNVFTIGAALTSFNQYVSYYLQIICMILLSAFGNAVGAVVFASLCRYKDSSSEHRRHSKHHHSDSSETSGTDAETNA